MWKWVDGKDILREIGCFTLELLLSQQSQEPTNLEQDQAADGQNFRISALIH